MLTAFDRFFRMLVTISSGICLLGRNNNQGTAPGRGTTQSSPAHIGVRAGGARGAAAPPVLKLFEQNAYDSGKSTWDKLCTESSFYNTTKSGPS